MSEKPPFTAPPDPPSGPQRPGPSGGAGFVRRPIGWLVLLLLSTAAIYGACLEIGSRLPGGFVLMPACEMPVIAPPLNVQALVQAARDFNLKNGSEEREE